MAVIEEKFNRKVSFWETRSHSRNDRFYTEKKPIEEAEAIGTDIDQSKNTGTQGKIARVGKDVEAMTPSLAVIDKASVSTETLVAEMPGMPVNVEASLTKRTIEENEIKVEDLVNRAEKSKPREEDSMIEKEKEDMRPNVPLASPQDGRRKSRLGIRSQTMLGGLKRRMSFLGREKI
jgi:hypothetical protein